MPHVNGHFFKIMLLVFIGAVTTIAVMGSVYSPDNATQILGFCGLIVAQLVGMLQGAVASEKIEATAVKVEEVAKDLKENTSKTDRKLDSISQDGKTVILNTNSALGHALELTARATARTAELSGEQADVEIAKLAREASDKHQENQAKVEAKDAKVKAKDQNTTLQVAKDTVDGAASEIKEKIDDIPVK